MAQENIVDFGAGQSALEELSGASPIMWNLLADAGNAVLQRPGLRAWSDFASAIPNASPVIGMYAWRQYLIYVCDDRTIWAWYGPGDIRALSDATDTTTTLDGSLRPVFAYDYERVVITGGGATQKWEGAGLSARLGGSPPTATHIAYNDQRFVLSIYDNTGRIQWTPPGVTNHETWTTAGVGSGGFAEAEASPDPAMALHVNANETFVFGTQSLQVFVPDATSGFVVGSTVTVGCGCRHGIIDTDGSYAWLDERQRIVSSSGRDIQVLSSPGMSKSIAALVTVSDGWSFRASIGSFDLLVWVFPTDGRTLCFDRGSGKWSEWKTWTGASWSGWIGSSYYHWADRNIHLVGLSTGEIVEMTFDAYQDNGLNIRGISRTGFGDGGVGVRKLSQRVQLQLKRTGALAATDGSVELRYRDDLGAFRTATAFPVGGDYAPSIIKYGLGMYRERQWEIVFENNAALVLAGARETIELGDS